MKKSKCEKAAERYEKRLDSFGIKTSNTLRPSYDFIKGAQALLRYAKTLTNEEKLFLNKETAHARFRFVELLEQWVKGEK